MSHTADLEMELPIRFNRIHMDGISPLHIDFLLRKPERFKDRRTIMSLNERQRTALQQQQTIVEEQLVQINEKLSMMQQRQVLLDQQLALLKERKEFHEQLLATLNRMLVEDKEDGELTVEKILEAAILL